MITITFLAPVNKLVPATSLLWALQKSRVYYYNFVSRKACLFGLRCSGFRG